MLAINANKYANKYVKILIHSLIHVYNITRIFGRRCIDIRSRVLKCMSIIARFYISNNIVRLQFDEDSINARRNKLYISACINVYRIQVSPFPTIQSALFIFN